MEVREVYLPSEYEINGERRFHVVHYKAEKNGSDLYLISKRIFDIFLSLLSIIAFSPLLVAVSVLIRLTTEGPAFYKQKRVGKNGNIFTIYKFRTMVDGADRLEEHLTKELIEFYQVNRKIVNDPRVTAIGKILRRTSLDELPQIFNILKGEMTVVGPRPMLPDEIEMYGRNFSRYVTVKPGLTGLWQIKCRNMTTMNERAKLDGEYIGDRCFGRDLSIILQTIKVVFSKKGAC